MKNAFSFPLLNCSNFGKLLTTDLHTLLYLQDTVEVLSPLLANFINMLAKLSYFPEEYKIRNKNLDLRGVKLSLQIQTTL